MFHVINMETIISYLCKIATIQKKVTYSEWCIATYFILDFKIALEFSSETFELEFSVGLQFHQHWGDFSGRENNNADIDVRIITII